MWVFLICKYFKIFNTIKIYILMKTLSYVNDLMFNLNFLRILINYHVCLWSIFVRRKTPNYLHLWSDFFVNFFDAKCLSIVYICIFTFLLSSRKITFPLILILRLQIFVCDFDLCRFDIFYTTITILKLVPCAEWTLYIYIYIYYILCFYILWNNVYMYIYMLNN